jgi:hypothetical protein
MITRQRARLAASTLALVLTLISFAIVFAVPVRPQSTGVLRVKTDTSDVHIWLDGEEVGRAPLTLRTVASGKRRLALMKDGYEDHQQEIEVLPNQTNSIFVVMKPLTLKLPALPTEFKAIHQHRTGTCVGTLTVSAEALDYKAINDSDRFHIPIAGIKSVARSWGPVAGLAPMGIRAPTDFMAFRIETSGRSYGFFAFKDTPDDSVKVASEKTRELYEVVFKLWSATLTKKD